VSDCGGCQGAGRHKRWCEAVVGRSAAMMGRLSERAESLGDSIGPNEMGAANHVWIAAGLLKEEAQRRAAEYMEQNGTSH
jgi:hypothetical protein